MVWWHAEDIATVQSAYHRLRRTELGRRLTPVWSAAALHRPAEFNKSHIPAFMADEHAEATHLRLPVRALLRLVPAGRQGAARHARASTASMARDYPDVRANTIASFALNDYEWVLAFEADELHRIVDLMRELRASRGAAARARGGAVLHRPARDGARPGRRASLSRVPARPGSWRGSSWGGGSWRGGSWRGGLSAAAATGVRAPSPRRSPPAALPRCGDRGSASG